MYLKTDFQFESKHTFKNKKPEYIGRVFTHLVSLLRSCPPHPGFEEHWFPPVQRSSSPFHQNSSARHHLVLYAGRELFDCQIPVPLFFFCKNVYHHLCLCRVISILLQPSIPTYLLFVDFKCLLDIGDLWGANRQILDFSGSESTEVTDRFDVSGAYELPKTTRPMRRTNTVNTQMHLIRWISFRLYMDSKRINV